MADREVDFLPASHTHLPHQKSGTLLITLFIIVTAGLLLASSLIYRAYKKHYRIEVEHRLSAIAELKVAELQQWRRERLGDADILISNTHLHEFIRRYLKNPKDNDSADRISDFLSQYPERYDYDQVSLLDLEGNTRLSIPPNNQPTSATLLENIQDPSKSKKIILVDFYRNESDKRIYLGVLIPIQTGFLYLRIDPEKSLYPIILRWPTPSKTAETFLVRREGNNVLFLNELKLAKNTALNLRVSLERTEIPSVMAILGKTGIVEGIDYRGSPTLADIRPVPDSPWFLVARMMTTEVYAEMGTYLWMTSAFAFALIIGSGAVLIFLSRKQNLDFYRKQAQAAEVLRENSEVYQAILATTCDGFWLTDTRGKLINVNATYARLSGYTIRELLQMQISELEVKSDSDASLLAHLKHPMNSQIDLFESLHRRKDGSNWPVEVSCSFRPGGGGQFIVFLRDITLRKQSELALLEAKNAAEEATKNKTRFLDIAVHELRTPITAFSLLLQLAHKQAIKGQPLSTTTLLKLQELAERLKRLVTDLLDLSRVERGLMILHPVRTNIVSLVSEIVGEFQLQSPQRIMTVQAPDELIELDVDPVKINQVLSNLIDNAIKYTDEGRPIEIGLESLPTLIRISVIDHGAGIPKDQLADLFTAFTRGPGDVVAQARGLGLGLAVCREIIGLHGGRVGVQSEVGNGSTFYFELPRSDLPLGNP